MTIHRLIIEKKHSFNLFLKVLNQHTKQCALRTQSRRIVIHLSDGDNLQEFLLIKLI